MEESFRKVFEVLDRDRFLQTPESILSYMRDAGFQKPVVKLLEMVIGVERRRFLLLMTCPQEEMGDQIHMIADNCFLNEAVLGDVIGDLRSAFDDKIKTVVIEHPKYGRCRSTMDRIAIFSEDFTKLLHVDEGVQSFVIPDSVVHIGAGAFSDCASLNTVSLPDSLETIGPYAFSHCTSLKEMFVPGSIKRINGGAFEGCLGIDLHIGRNDIATNGIYYIANGCLFRKTSPLESVFLNKHDTLLTGYGLVKEGEGVIPGTVSEIGPVAFSGCTTLIRVTIPESVSSISVAAFEDCTSLEEIVIKNSEININADAFEGCCSLKKVIIPKSFNEIDVFPNGVQFIIGKDGINKDLN